MGRLKRSADPTYSAFAKPTSSESVDQRDDSDLALVGAQPLPVGW